MAARTKAKVGSNTSAPYNPRAGAHVREPLEWSSSADAFEIPEWADLGCGELSAAAMSRHTLILGETGSGKTKSAIFPLTKAALRYGRESGESPCMLIIDPKREIAGFAREVDAQENLERTFLQCDVGSGDWVLDFFDGVDAATLTGEAFVARIYGLTESAEMDRTNGTGNSTFFSVQAASILQYLVDLEIHFWHAGGAPAVKRYYQAVQIEMTGEPLSTRPFGPIAWQDPNYLRRFVDILGVASTNQSQMIGTIVRVAKEMKAPELLLMLLSSYATMAGETFTSVIATANNRLSVLASPELARHVWLNPFEAPTTGTVISAMQSLERGDVICYYPLDTSATSTTIGRCLKAKFFEMTFARSNRERPFVYVCDEFQRFITNDPISGEQSFLDRCRAYRAACVLATQSVASLSYTLSQQGGGASDESALDILFNNTGTKLFFRNTDLATQSRLQGLLPQAPIAGLPHVISTRPVSTLEVGECYYMLSNGKWGRRKIVLHKPFNQSGNTAEPLSNTK